MLPTNAQVARSDHDLLIAMNTKLDIALTRQDDQERRIREVESRPVGSPDVRAKVEDHETRIRWLETRLLVLAGGAATLGAGGTLGLQRLIGG